MITPSLTGCRTPGSKPEEWRVPPRSRQHQGAADGARSWVGSRGLAQGMLRQRVLAFTFAEGLKSCLIEEPAGMPATMKALRKTKAGKGLEMQAVPVPSIGPADVLVRVKATSICGTDLHIYGWDRWSQGRI